MAIVKSKVIEPLSGPYNLEDYEKARENFSWDEASKVLSFYQTGKLNATYEIVDRHVNEGYGDKIALHFRHEQATTSYTFNDIKQQINHYARIIKSNGIVKGDRVFIFLPKSPECYIAILAAVKVGAIAVPLFEAFMEDAVKERMNDCEGKLLITDFTMVERVPEKDIPSLKTILFVEEIEHIAYEDVPESALIEWVDVDDGFLIHYTSGSTGKPKGVLLTHGAITHQFITGKWVLDIKDDDVYWCTSHPGWVTGSVYGLIAPWLNRATVVVQGGRFTAEDWYELIEELRVTIWYSAPTAFRMLLSEGDAIQKYDLSSLRHVLSVGEPLNPEVIHWAWETLKVRIHDTWWMTETGGHLIVNVPSEKIKPGSMGKPFPGITVGILDE